MNFIEIPTKIESKIKTKINSKIPKNTIDANTGPGLVSKTFHKLSI
jgi:hypothetical protein